MNIIEADDHEDRLSQHSAPESSASSQEDSSIDQDGKTQNPNNKGD